MNILLVEDHPDTAALLKLYLERHGHEVATAGTCEGALRHPDLVRMEVLICDLGLPDCSGFSTSCPNCAPTRGMPTPWPSRPAAFPATRPEASQRAFKRT